MKIEDYDIKELSDNLILQIRNLVDGNQATAKDVLAKNFNAEIFSVLFNVQWSFSAHTEKQKIAGGNESEYHFGNDNLSFERKCEEIYQRAMNDESLRQDFLLNLINLEKDGLLKSDVEYAFYDFGSLSVNKSCSQCGGKGKTTCGSCGGRGKQRCNTCGGGGRCAHQQAEYRNGQYAGNKTVYRSCNNCGGSGKNTCGSCSGYGKVRCSHCSGYGFFTITHHITATATPEYCAQTNTKYNKEALDRQLMNSGPLFCAQKISFQLKEHGSSGDANYLFSYEGNGIALEQYIQLHNKNYVCCAFSNPPFPYVRPKIFDDLFADEITYLQKITPSNGRISKKKAIKFFNRYAGQPVLDESMRNIAKERRKTKEKTGNLVKIACQGFISNEMAENLSIYLNQLMDKISPTYSIFVWLLTGFITFTFAGLSVEHYAENHITSEPFVSFFIGAISTLFLSLVGAFFAFLLSPIVVLFARRKIPAEYRQKMRHKEPFRKFIKVGMLCFLFSIAYGFSATKGWVPKTHGLPLKIVVQQWQKQKKQACHYLEDMTFLEKYCPSNPKPELSKEQKIRAIQATLKNLGYDLIVDGKFGKNSRRVANNYLKERDIEISQDLSVDYYYDEIVE